MGKVYVAPAGTPFEELVQPANDISHLLQPPNPMDALLDEWGIPHDQRASFVEAVDKAARALTSSPAEELKWRLNAQLRGDDPGKPINWRGLR